MFAPPTSGVSAKARSSTEDIVQRGGTDSADPGTAIALVTGMSYALIGLLVAFGIAAPGDGAKLLNVEDAEELREESPKLRYGAVACFLILTRQINLEASTLTLLLAMALFGGWAALAHLDFTGWVTPLALIAVLALIQLVSIMIVCARRGLMMPR